MDEICIDNKATSIKKTTSSVTQLNINDFRKHGLLSEGRFGIVEINGRGYYNSLGFRAGESELVLMYAAPRDNQMTNYCYPVPVTWTRCNFGGERPWFVCTGCNRRCGILYVRIENNYFQCRECQNLCYQSQREGKFGRAILRIYHYRRKLGVYSSLLDWAPIERPRHMRHMRFFRLLAAIATRERDMVRFAPFNPYLLPKNGTSDT